MRYELEEFNYRGGKERGYPELGNKTVFVGGFSTIGSINAAVDEIKTNKDRIVLLKGSYEGNVTLDSTKLKGLVITGEDSASAHDVKIDGSLTLSWSQPPPRSAEEEEAAAAEEPPAPAAGEGEEGEVGEEGAEGGDGEEHPQPTLYTPPKLLTLSRLTFLQGATAEAQTDAEIIDCNFGSKTGSHPLVDCVKSHGFSTVLFRRCRIYGSGRSAVYCFPRSKSLFDRCDIVGSEKPKPSAAPVKHKRGYVPPPPPPPTAPEKCECDTGVFCDDASTSFKECTFSQFDIGVVTRDACLGTSFDRCALSLISTVGMLLDGGSKPAIRKSILKLCRRECIVVGDYAHPTLRGNTFVGDVRLKRHAVATGMSDNLVALNGKLIDDGEIFGVKGFTFMAEDPTVPKPKKIKKEEDE